MHPFLGDAVQPPPDPVVERHHEDTHHADAQGDAREVAGRRHLLDVAAQARGLELGVAPGHVFGHDAGVPGAAAGRDGAGDEAREDGRQQVAPPGQPALEPEVLRGQAQLGRDGGGARHHVEQQIPLGAQDDQRRQPDVRVQAQLDDHDHRNREHQIGREGRQELGDGLHAAGDARVQADPHADGHPDQRGHRDQRQHPRQREQAELEHMRRLAPAHLAVDEAHQPPQREQHQRGDEGVPAARPQRVGRPGLGADGAAVVALAQRPEAGRDPARRPLAELLQQRGAAQPGQQPGLRRVLAAGLLEAELVGPGQQRPKEQLVVEQDADQHAQDGPADGGQVLGLDGQRDVGAHAGQLDVLPRHRDGLGGDNEEPAAAHAHHHVPQQARHRERQLQPPEALPARELEDARGLLQLARHGAQRLVEAEGHVPGLAGEDGEQRRQLHTEQIAREQRDEGRHRDGLEAQDGNGLQDVQQRHQHLLGRLDLGGQHRKHAGEQHRGPEGDEHAQRGAQQVIGQVGNVQAQRQRLAEMEGLGHLRRGQRQQDEHRQHQRQQRPVPAVEAGLDDRAGKEATVGHGPAANQPASLAGPCLWSVKPAVAKLAQAIRTGGRGRDDPWPRPWCAGISRCPGRARSARPRAPPPRYRTRPAPPSSAGCW
mmetsp:Transcript_21587/g.51171  ORF Transcript_21587/g.51171 Transcript_21587/m.51171 type:complete len:655 (+) Transcript_21587:263-2227(+)